MAEVKKQIHIEIRDKVATLKSMNFQMVGGNNDYEVVFDFDEDWANYTAKTALFVYGTDTKKVVFDGNVCKGVAVKNATICFIGVFADDIATTTPACVSGIRQSIRDIATDLPEAPEEDVYNQIMELLNRYIEQGGGGGGEAGFSPIVKVEAIEGGHRVTITDANGDHSFDVMDGKDGSDYVITDEDIEELSRKVQRVLYMHNIEIIGQAWVGNFYGDCRLTLYNDHPESYGVDFEVDTGGGTFGREPTVDDFLFLPNGVMISCSGTIAEDAIGNTWYPIYAIGRNGHYISVYYHTDDGNGGSQTYDVSEIEYLRDEVIARPLSDLPNGDEVRY